MDHATIKLTTGPDGRVTACLANPESVAPYDLVVIADDLADAISKGGLDGLRKRLGQLAGELRVEQPR